MTDQPTATDCGCRVKAPTEVIATITELACSNKLTIAERNAVRWLITQACEYCRTGARHTDWTWHPAAGTGTSLH